jgi:hypothetical protein
MDSYILKYGPEGVNLRRLKSKYASNFRWGNYGVATLALEEYRELKQRLNSALKTLRKAAQKPVHSCGYYH